MSLSENIVGKILGKKKQQHEMSEKPQEEVEEHLKKMEYKNKGKVHY